LEEPCPEKKSDKKGEKKIQERMIFVDELPHIVPQLLSAHNKTSAKGMAN
jgi:hypothetical protein